MARTGVLLSALAAIVTVASSQNANYAADLAKLKSAASALPGQFDKQWASALTKVHADREAAQAVLLKALPSAAAKAAFNKAIAALDQAVNQKKTFFASFRPEQGSQFTALANKYLNLAKNAAQTKGSDILAVRKEKQALLANWENGVVAHLSDSRVTYDNTLRAAIKATKANAADGKALDSARVSLMETIIDTQVTLLDVLINKQFARVEEFALQAGGLVFHLLVAGNRPL